MTLIYLHSIYYFFILSFIHKTLYKRRKSYVVIPLAWDYLFLRVLVSVIDFSAGLYAYFFF